MNNHDDAIAHCCAECGKEEGVSLKMCKSCLETKYCDATCQKNHWAKHKTACKLRAAELRDVALFKDPPAKEDCPICFLPMPILLICCASLPPATLMSAPIYDFAIANNGVEDKAMEEYYPCCGKSVCKGCLHSFSESGNDDKCPFCNSDQGKSEEEDNEDIMKRVAVNDAASICMLAQHYHLGRAGFQRDHTKAMELYVRAANLGNSKAHYNMAGIYQGVGDLKKAKFHLEAAAMAGNEVARYRLGCMEVKSRNMDRAVKHWTIAASAGCFRAMDELRKFFKRSFVSRESINSTLTAYNNSCAEMKSESRDACIRFKTEIN